MRLWTVLANGSRRAAWLGDLQRACAEREEELEALSLQPYPDPLWSFVDLYY